MGDAVPSLEELNGVVEPRHLPEQGVVLVPVHILLSFAINVFDNLPNGPFQVRVEVEFLVLSNLAEVLLVTEDLRNRLRLGRERLGRVFFWLLGVICLFFCRVVC